ncbi:unnamed protein product, partial [Polarella glacialis]
MDGDSKEADDHRTLEFRFEEPRRGCDAVEVWEYPDSGGRTGSEQTGSRVWDASLILARHLERRKELPAAVLELGALHRSAGPTAATAKELGPTHLHGGAANVRCPGLEQLARGALSLGGQVAAPRGVASRAR